MLREAAQGSLIADLECVGDAAPVAQSHQAGDVVLRERPGQIFAVRVLEELGLLVLVRRIQQELAVDDAKLLVVLVYAALSEDEDLLPLGESADRDGPLL